jgi:hypothetical protein
MALKKAREEEKELWILTCNNEHPGLGGEDLRIVVCCTAVAVCCADEIV